MGGLARALRLEAIEPPRQTGNLARRGIAMEHALGGGLAQHLHRLAQRAGSTLGVAAAQRLLRAFERAMDMGLDGAIAHPAFEAAPMALDGGWMYWHVWHIEPMSLTTAWDPVNGFTAMVQTRPGRGRSIAACAA